MPSERLELSMLSRKIKSLLGFQLHEGALFNFGPSGGRIIQFWYAAPESNRVLKIKSLLHILTCSQRINLAPPAGFEPAYSG